MKAVNTQHVHGDRKVCRGAGMPLYLRKLPALLLQASKVLTCLISEEKFCPDSYFLVGGCWKVMPSETEVTGRDTGINSRDSSVAGMLGA